MAIPALGKMNAHQFRVKGRWWIPLIPRVARKMEKVVRKKNHTQKRKRKMAARRPMMEMMAPTEVEGMGRERAKVEVGRMVRDCKPREANAAEV
jgi:hypothetical protein